MRKVAGAVAIVLAGLACSACGSFLLNGVARGGGTVRAITTVESVPPLYIQNLSFSRRGIGTQSLGTYAIHGWVRLKASCVGTGKFEVRFVYLHARNHNADSTGESARCLNSKLTPTIAVYGNEGVYEHRARIVVRAPADMKWWVAIVDRQPAPPHH